ncbi:MAG: hypothetical protein Q9180_007760, partial [Flavoplaca navasiana]
EQVKDKLTHYNKPKDLYIGKSAGQDRRPATAPTTLQRRSNDLNVANDPIPSRPIQRTFNDRSTTTITLTNGHIAYNVYHA